MRCGNACQLERIAAACAGAPRQPCAAIRVPLSRCVGPGVLAGKNRAVCIPISPNARNGPSFWQHPPEMHAFRDQDGNIFALCIHFQAQSGDSGYMARESCRQGAFSRRGARNHAWREDVASAVQPFRGSGLRSGRTGFAPYSPVERALRSGTPSSLAACAGLCHLARAAPPPLRCPCPRTLPRAPPPRRAGSAAVPAIPAK